MRCPVCRSSIQVAYGGPAPPEGAISVRLIVRAGLVRPGSQLILSGSAPIEVGKLSGKHLVLPGSLVSRNHCRLVPHDGRWQLVDDRSTNGSYVNGVRVACRDLVDGDIVRLGEYEFEFKDVPAAPVPTAPDRQAEPAREQPFATVEPYDQPIPVFFADDEEPSQDRSPVSIDAAAPPRIPGAPATSTTPAEMVSDPSDYGSYDISPTPAPSHPARASMGGRDSTAAEGRAPRFAAPRTPVPVLVCPACNRTLSPGAKICVECGVDVRTGRPIITAHGLDEVQLFGNAETLVRIVSWVLPFGLYPIASEAYGAFKPYATWAIALLTIVTSICYWIAGDDPRGPNRQLMLWAGSISSQQIQAIYADSNEIDEADREAYDQKVEELKSTVPSQQLPLAAYEALSPEHRLFGHFEWYQLLTCAFLHGSWMHLAGNLVFLLVFGSRVNALVGQWKMVLLYPVLAASAGIAYFLAESGNFPMPSLGASGAIMGLAGTYLILFPVHRVHNVIWFRISPLIAPLLMLRVWASSGGESGLLRPWMKVFALRGFWVVSFYISFDVVHTAFHIRDHVAHWAHMGGFIGGVIIGLALLLTRVVDARGGDLLSVLLGKHAWRLIGKPGDHRSKRPRIGNEGPRGDAAIESLRETT
jgi:membrane associated rhomboid family serine protease/pSer/pThr/pTyr-binding forkhead associated (FHA) protein